MMRQLRKSCLLFIGALPQDMMLDKSQDNVPID
jgi:hypothetical protein